MKAKSIPSPIDAFLQLLRDNTEKTKTKSKLRDVLLRHSNINHSPTLSFNSKFPDSRTSVKTFRSKTMLKADYSPRINKKSRIIARQLQDSAQRITQTKKPIVIPEYQFSHRPAINRRSVKLD